MLGFVTKEQYWAAEDAGVLSLYEMDDWWHIKTIQDAVVLHRYKDFSGRRIADIGSSEGRIVRHLAKKNKCYCIDGLVEHSGGVGKLPKIPGAKNIVATIGEFSSDVPEAHFDAVYSISVVEHVPDAMVEDFFKDCRRILKPGGEMMHLIDLYVETDPSQNAAVNQRLELYRKAFSLGFEPLGEILPPGGIAFDCRYASNPDNMMNRWNKSAPGLREKRLRSQACTLIMLARRT
ncbi:MAG: class I SAM-dependent methyltransferase [Terricaulis sp.]|nr:class I SAM-dependent methyltransferase [Terricaulis sp.]